MSGIDIIHLITALIAIAAAVASLVRIRIGPTLLDRANANDVLTAAMIGLIAVMIVWWSRPDLGVLLIVIALTGFMSSVVVARFAAREGRRGERILSQEEAETQRLEREEEDRQAALEEAGEAMREAEDPS